MLWEWIQMGKDSLLLPHEIKNTKHCHKIKQRKKSKVAVAMPN